MQIKTTMRYHLTLIRMAIIKKSTNKKCWRAGEEKKTPSTLLVGLKNWCSYYGKQYGGSLKNKKVELPYDPVIPLLDREKP